MALLHRAELRPSKLELLAGWLPARPWFPGSIDGPPVPVGSYRFDDPAGEVGIETILVRWGEGPVLQAPLTYRSAPLPGADEWLVGNIEHSVLGTRWVYDGCADPVYVAVLADVILSGGSEVEQYFEVDGERLVRPPTCTVRGTGTAVDPPGATFGALVEGNPTSITAGAVELAVARIVDQDAFPAFDDAEMLIGSWSAAQAPLAWARNA